MKKEQTRFRFNPEITLGHVLQLASVFAVLSAMWFNMDKRVTSVELRQDFAAEERRELKKSLATLAESQALLTRTVDRVTILFEERYKERR
jgi:predicted outer membrane lipoprotein